MQHNKLMTDTSNKCVFHCFSFLSFASSILLDGQVTLGLPCKYF